MGIVAVANLAASAQGVGSRDDHRHLTMNQLRRQLWQAIVLALGLAEMDRDVLTFDVAQRLQARAERIHQMLGLSGRAGAPWLSSR
jgi:hypothetical protein